MIHSDARLDCLCVVLLPGLPEYISKKPQMVQNTAASVVCSVGKYDYVTCTYSDDSIDCLASSAPSTRRAF